MTTATNIQGIEITSATCHCCDEGTTLLLGDATSDTRKAIESATGERFVGGEMHFCIPAAEAAEILATEILV